MVHGRPPQHGIYNHPGASGAEAAGDTHRRLSAHAGGVAHDQLGRSLLSSNASLTSTNTTDHALVDYTWSVIQYGGSLTPHTAWAARPFVNRNISRFRRALGSGIVQWCARACARAQIRTTQEPGADEIARSTDSTFN